MTLYPASLKNIKISQITELFRVNGVFYLEEQKSHFIIFWNDLFNYYMFPCFLTQRTKRNFLADSVPIL